MERESFWGDPVLSTSSFASLSSAKVIALTALVAHLLLENSPKPIPLPSWPGSLLIMSLLLKR